MSEAEGTDRSVTVDDILITIKEWLEKENKVVSNVDIQDGELLFHLDDTNQDFAIIVEEF